MPESAASRSTSTGNTGAYALPSLVPGGYELTVEKTGFATFEVREITLTVDQTLTVNAHLQLSPVNQTVTVNAADLPVVDLQSSSISNVVNAAEISQLPLLLRDPYTLVLLSPGVIQSNTSLGGFSANGARERDNNFLLDGVDDNDPNVPGTPHGMSTIMAMINPDSAQEFRVITNNFSAEIGRDDGAVIDIITKHGTDELHGDAYWFGRYSALGARDFFATTKNPYTRNDFGASLGGPVRHDKVFFFANYEGQRFLTTLTNTSTVPTEAFKTGIFTYDSTSVNVSTPASANNNTGLALDPTLQKLLALYPTPNGAPVDDIRGQLNFPSTSHLVADNLTTRMDANLSSHNTFVARYVFNQGSDPNPMHDDVLPGGIGAVGTQQRAQNLALRLTSVLSPTLLNELRGGANRSSQQFYCGTLGVLDQFGSLDQFGRGTDFSMMPDIANFGCQNVGDANGQTHHTGTYSAGDDLTWVKGTHTLKAGGEYRGVYFNGFDDFFSRQSVSFSVFPSVSPVKNGPTCPGGCYVLQNMVAVLQGLVYNQSQDQFFNSAGDRTADDLRGYRQHETGLYIQDSWKLRSNLTVNYGLRWEYFGVPYEVHDNLSNLYVPANGTAPFTFSIVGRNGVSLYNPDFHDFAPRVGLAWDPFKTGKTSVRAGFGIFYDRAYDNLFGNAAGNPPFEERSSTFPFRAYTGLALPTQLTPSATVQQAAFDSPVLIDPNLKNPSSMNWSLGLQREITHGLTFEADYVGRKGTHLFRAVNGNQPSPSLVATLVADCSVPNPYNCTPASLQGAILYYGGSYGYLPANAVYNNALYYPTLVESTANSIYSGLQTKTTLEDWHGLHAQLSYTYSHAIDNASDPLAPANGDTFLPVNSLNLAAERGNSDFDIRNVAVLNFSYGLPIGRGTPHWNSGFLGRALEGWRVGGIATFQGGLPFDIFGDVDSQHTGIDDRATIIGNPQPPAGTDKTFTGPALSAFEETPIGQASNLSRNRFYGPGMNNWDTILMKNTSLTKRTSLQLRFEFYNLFNRTEFATPVGQLADTGTFGKSISTLVRPDGTSSAREIQLAAKIIF